MNDRLYYNDPYLVQFTAHVLTQQTDDAGRAYVVLDQTAFYPTGGGQPCDLGEINGIAVTGVEEQAGAIRHYLAAPLPPDTTRVSGSIDWARRFDHMQQHAGQHILSAAFAELYEAETVGFHLGKERVTIDLAIPVLSPEMAVEAESLANRIVMESRPIVARFVEQTELERYPLRKAPTVQEDIRLVIIDRFDYNPCGGTHPRHTGEVGPIKIMDWEKHKGQIRLSFLCGERTLAEMESMRLILQQLSRAASSPGKELPQTFIRMQAERQELERALTDAHSRLLAMEADALIRQAERTAGQVLVNAAFANRPLPELQKLAQWITSQESRALVLFAVRNDKLQLIVARGADLPLAANALLKELLPLVNGKGGGTPQMAQGGGEPSITPEEWLAHARQRLPHYMS